MFKSGDRVRIVLKKPYTKKEIMNGCHPGVNGKYAIVQSKGTNDLYYLKLEEKMQPHKLHKDIPDFEMEFEYYYEEEKNLELA